MVATRVVTPDPRQALNAVRTLRGCLRTLGLAGEERWEARRALDEIEDELRSRHPNRNHVAERFERFTELLGDAGALDPGRRSVTRRLRAIATWVGPTGAALVGRVA
jgi:hypothetical protein